MRETIRSLKAYLIVAGILGTVSTGAPLLSGGKGFSVLIGLAGMAISLGYVYVGFRLRTLLADSPQTVLHFFQLVAAFLILVLVVDAVQGKTLLGLPAVIVGLLLTWYLYANARRLSAEAATASPQPVAP